MEVELQWAVRVELRWVAKVELQWVVMVELLLKSVSDGLEGIEDLY